MPEHRPVVGVVVPATGKKLNGVNIAKVTETLAAGGPLEKVSVSRGELRELVDAVLATRETSRVACEARVLAKLLAQRLGL